MTLKAQVYFLFPCSAPSRTVERSSLSKYTPLMNASGGWTFLFKHSNHLHMRCCQYEMSVQKCMRRNQQTVLADENYMTLHNPERNTDMGSILYVSESDCYI